MTFDDDFIQLELASGTHRMFCSRVGLTWPPPERLTFDEGGMRIANHDDPDERVLVRETMSIISDEQRAEMTNVCRGAVYRYAPAVVRG